MTVKVAIDTKALSEACARFGVARLRVFGSVLTDHFDPQASDIDFLVDFLECVVFLGLGEFFFP